MFFIRCGHLFSLILLCLICSIANSANMFSRQTILMDKSGHLYKSLPLIIKSDGLNANGMAIYKIDMENANAQLFYQSNSNCFQSMLAISSTDNYISFLQGCVEGDSIYEENNLVIIEKESKRQIIVSDRVYSYCWHFDKDLIVYITGIDREGFPGFTSNGVWVFDIKTNKKHKIAENGYDVFWSEHDGNIYVTNFFQVFRYDVKKEAGEVVPYKGIYFSPDGKYYCEGNYEGNPSYIYRTADNKPIEEWNKKLSQMDQYFTFYSWITGSQAALFRINDRNIVFDVHTGGISQEFKGDVIGINKAGNKIFLNPVEVREDGRTGINREALEIVDVNPVK